MSTNILALPVAQMTIETGCNEDWIDSIVYLIDSTDPDSPQLDLTGIEFEMEVRRRPPDHEVILQASTKNGTITIGTPPDYGYLIIMVPLEEMETKSPGQYVGDIRAKDDEFTRICVQFDLTLVQGITRGVVVR